GPTGDSGSRAPRSPRPGLPASAGAGPRATPRSPAEAFSPPSGARAPRWLRGHRALGASAARPRSSPTTPRQGAHPPAPSRRSAPRSGSGLVLRRPSYAVISLNLVPKQVSDHIALHLALARAPDLRRGGPTR